MERIYVTVGHDTIHFQASMTVEAVKNGIRAGRDLQGGWLELETLVVVEGDLLIPAQCRLLKGAFL